MRVARPPSDVRGWTKKNKSSFKRFQENNMETSSKFKETKGKIMASGAFSGIADMGDPECYVTFAHEKIW